MRNISQEIFVAISSFYIMSEIDSVSYTHLTLPTN